MSVYSSVRGLKPHRSKFKIGYDFKFDCDAGQLIPIFCKSVVPSDVINLSQEIVVRAPAALAPYMAELNAHTYTFFVPYRILFGEMQDDEEIDVGSKKLIFRHWEISDHEFEKFIGGGRSGNLTVSLPRWIPTGQNVVNDNWNGIPAGSEGSNLNDINVTVPDNGKYSLWDYFCFPTGVIPAGAYPLDFPKRAYNLIYNEWFLDNNLMPAVDVANSNIVLNACWKKDYFTSALPWQQRGTAPAFPISGTAKAVFSNPISIQGVISDYIGPSQAYYSILEQGQNAVFANNSSSSISNPHNYYRLQVNSNTLTERNTVDLGSAVTFDVSTLRYAFQVQKWLERNARGGSRYVELLKAHFGTSPTDDTLQRPMFIGGSKSPIIVSEVLQTGNGGEGVGSLFGHTISADANHVTKFHVNEYGLIMTLMCIKPKATYQQGIDREWLYETKYDFLFPEFVNLSEEAVYQAELFASNDENENKKIFGYQGRYNELRTSQSHVAGGLRDSLSYWHMGRIFGTAPVLNGQFLKCNPRKDVFSVTDEPSYICYVGNVCHAYRPLPLYPEPGLIDHA
ncbi:major capsid protein [Capybara microvirus Cap3_SP_539]|nr:major capsid protein [Capybara microvirus Cap3_SP_539]